VPSGELVVGGGVVPPVAVQEPKFDWQPVPQKVGLAPQKPKDEQHWPEGHL